MITLTIIGIGLKGLVALGVLSTLLLTACSKENTGQCSVCTVETTYNGAVLHTSTIEQTTRTGDPSGGCSMSQDEFKQSLVDEVTAQGLNANVSCEYE